MGKLLSGALTVLLAIVTSSGWQWSTLLQKRDFITEDQQLVLAVMLTAIFIIQQIYLVLPSPIPRSVAYARSSVIENYLSQLLLEYYSIIKNGQPEGWQAPLVRINVMLPTLRLRGIFGRYLKIYYRQCPPGCTYSAQEEHMKWPKRHGLCGAVWRMGRGASFDITNIKDASLNNLNAKQKAATAGLVSAFSVPIWCNRQCVGVLNIDSEAPMTQTQLNDQALQNKVKDYADRLGEHLFFEGVAA